jgi:hypothetical protein
VLAIQQTLTATEYPQFKGRAVSLSVRIKTSVANMVRIGIYDGAAWQYSPYHNGNGTYQTLTVSNATLSAAAAAWYIGIWWDAAISGLAYLDNANLVVGSQAANYVPLHPADDLARCLRYYERIGFAATSTFFAGWGGAVGMAFGQTMFFAAKKAVSPTLTKLGTWTAGNASQPNVDAADVGGFRIYATANGIAAVSIAATDSTCGITAEANP